MIPTSQHQRNGTRPSAGRDRRALRIRPDRVVPACCVLLCGMLLGCGYSADRLIRDDMRSVYVEYFQNDTWRQGLEVELKRALSRELRLHGGFQAASRTGADSLLEGVLLDYSIGSVTRTADEEVLMKRITVELKYRWTDGLSGRELAPWTRVKRSVFVAVEHQDTREAAVAFQKIAQVLVQGMERPW